MTTTEKKETRSNKVWENLQLVVFIGTIMGQMLVGAFYFVAQSLWLACNILALTRNFVLDRPLADKIKDGGMCGVSLALIILRAFGIY